jgi:hypothetical protein
MATLALALLLLVAQQTPTPQSAQDRANGAIEGIVLDISNNQPVPGARIRIAPRDGSPYAASEYADLPTSFTDANGRFTLAGLKAAIYTLVIDGNGYVSQRYGQRTFPGTGPTITLVPGQAIKGLSVRLTPTATVSGRIRDAGTREPLAGVPVQLMRLDYNTIGEMSLVRQQGFLQTDDRGEYRFHFVTPGRYYIKAGGALPQTSSRLEGPSPNVIVTDYSVSFYPDALKTQDATLIELKSGSDIGGMDLFLRRQTHYQIRGRIIDSRTGQAPASAPITLYERTSLRAERVEGVTIRTTNGTFTISGVPAGSYQLVVQPRAAGAPAGAALTAAPVLVASLETAVAFAAVQAAPNYGATVVPVDVTNADVDSLVIPISPGVPLAARVTVEGAASLNAFGNLRLVMRSSDQILASFVPITWSGNTGEGVARFTDLGTSEYRLSLNGALPQGFYLKEATLGGIDALRNNLRIREGDSASLNVIISPNAAVVEGMVRNEKLEPMPGSTVVLLPEQDRNRTELFQQAIADHEGRFRLSSVPPGNYRVLAWEALVPNTYFDKEVLRPVEQRSIPLQLRESARQSLDLTAIPAN